MILSIVLGAGLVAVLAWGFCQASDRDFYRQILDSLISEEALDAISIEPIIDPETVSKYVNQFPLHSA